MEGEGNDWQSNHSNIPTELRSLMDDKGHPIIKKSPREVTCGKVSPILRNRERSKHYYDPMVASFGPYHHGKPELQEAETLKTEIMLQFIAESHKPIMEFYSKVREMNRDIRACYVDGSTDEYCDNKFALMMLRDGCLILHIIDISVNLRGDEIFVLAQREGILRLHYLVRDMILLENQIPFRILDVLISLRYEEKVGLRMIKKFIYLLSWGISPKKVTGDEDKKPLHVNHLLDFIQKEFSKEGGQSQKPQVTEDPFDKDYIPSFGSVCELKAKGIHFKSNNSSSLCLSKKIKKSLSLRDVEFKSGFFYGELKLPPLILHSNTIILYTNLVAFELGPPTIEDLVITSYMHFLNTLIDNPNDVKELRSKRILFNNLGSDEEVVQMFREFATYWPNLLLYQSVTGDIEKHINSKIRTWIADIISKYFSNPWSAIGLIAAIIVIGLSALQTYFNINPVKDKCS